MDNLTQLNLLPINYSISFNKEVSKKRRTEGVGGVMGGVTGGAIDALTKRQKEVLNLIATNTTITYNEIAEALGINDHPLGKHINALETKGFLKIHGGTQGY